MTTLSRSMARSAALALACCTLAAAAQPAATIASPSVYAVNAAALSAAMTYCSTRHQNIHQGTAGAACFGHARNLLPELKLSNWAADIDRKCTERAAYNRCITPEIGRLVYALNDLFKTRGL